MKRQASKYISLVFLAVFIFTFSFQNISAANYVAKDNISLLAQKSKVSVHKPCDEDNADDQSLFENEKETEDESKTEYDSGLMIFDLPVYSLVLVNNIISYHPSFCEGLKDTHHPLYLVICTFRI